MLETSARLLRLLSLLQAHRDWPGADLADRLDVTPRTVRRDIDRLRELGYPVHSAPGTAGGYRLGAGAELPPLLLDDEEAVAVAVGLRTAAAGGVEGIEETSVRALAKLEQVLPHRLRRRVGALNAFTVPMLGGGGPGRGPEHPHRARARLPGLHPAAVRLRHARRHRHPPHRRTAPAGLRPPPLVPRRLGRGPRGLAHLPGRPHHPHPAARPALHPPPAARRGPRRVRLPGHLHPRLRPAGHGAAACLGGAGRGAHQSRPPGCWRRSTSRAVCCAPVRTAWR